MVKLLQRNSDPQDLTHVVGTCSFNFSNKSQFPHKLVLVKMKEMVYKLSKLANLNKFFACWIFIFELIKSNIEV